MIRKAGKSNIFVILNENEYVNKTNYILNDDTKFSKVNLGTIAKLKADVNKLIEISNYLNTSQEHKLKKVIGEHEPGYIYERQNWSKNVKIGLKLELESQIPTPTYQLGNSLN